MPGHMVSICEMILNTPFTADWEAIRRRKKKQWTKIANTKINIVNRTHIEYKIKY